jgi:hypothetical protein
VIGGARVPPTIRGVLIPWLQRRYAGRALTTGTPPGPVAVFSAAHPDVGDCSIWDDGNEATVGIGEIIHGHFNPCDESLSPDQIAAKVSETVVAFLDNLFADRVMCWSRLDGRGGGWESVPEGCDFPEPPDEARVFVWSGPLRRNT